MVTIKENVDVRIVQGLDAGRTLAITLPRSWMRECHIKKGDRVKLRRVDSHITLEKLDL